MKNLNEYECRITDFLTISKAKELYNEFLDCIKKDKKLIFAARLRDESNFPYKTMFDEYRHLIEFTELYVKDGNPKIRSTGKETQTKEKKYDGEILLENDEKITVEITAPMNGKSFKQKSNDLNANGYTNIEINDVNEKIKEIVDSIKSNAQKKSTKDYSTSILVICPIDMNVFLGLDSQIDDSILVEVQSALNDFIFKAKEVYLLISSNDSMKPNRLLMLQKN
jgi:hypothetical protein